MTDGQMRAVLRCLRRTHVPQRFARPRHHLDAAREVAHGTDERAVLCVPRHSLSL
ncbi:MAG: hypothetical protein WDM89_08965 [Rhizomicrobium sp.]